MSEKDLQQLLGRFLDGTASDQEKVLVEEWYSLWERENGYPVLTEERQAELDKRAFAVIRKRMNARQQVVRLWVSAAAAAVLIVALSYAYMYTHDMPLTFRTVEVSHSTTNNNSFVNKTSLVKILRLSDSTEVLLQPNSILDISTDFNESERKVFLKGEAFFNVAHNPDKPFFVYANAVVTRVLGTSFSVKALPHEKSTTVAVRTGKVSVYKQEDIESFDDLPDAIVLTTNHQAIYDPEKDKITHTLVKEPEIVVSKEEEKAIVKFTAAPIGDIFGALEKIYGVKIDYDEKAFSDRSLTIAISGQSFYDRMDSICEAIGATYSIEEGTILVKATDLIQDH
jgi:ferric-dicitrate binding protein FerR (iron transport regulator)